MTYVSQRDVSGLIHSQTNISSRLMEFGTELSYSLHRYQYMVLCCSDIYKHSFTGEWLLTFLNLLAIKQRLQFYCRIIAVPINHQFSRVIVRSPYNVWNMHTFILCHDNLLCFAWQCSMVQNFIVVSLLLRLKTPHLVSSTLITVDDFTALALLQPFKL